MAGSQTKRVKSISEFHSFKGLPQPEHPLISVIDYSDIACVPENHASNYVFDFYNIAVKRGVTGKLKYGQQAYDFNNGVMFFVSPDQVFGIEPNPDATVERSGWMLLIHPDFFWNTSLAQTIKQHEFFGYSVNEALFLSDREEATINGILQNIRQECSANIDKFSQGIIVSHIEALLNYSERFYHRQFITRNIANHKILDRLEKLLASYFNSDDLIIKGLPTVTYVADALNISPKYLSSLLKNLTGQNTQQHIHNKLIEKAKERLSTTPLSVSEIAYTLGFEHSQSFSKLFKSKTNLSPLEFRGSFA
ncbi:AraC family transcriptional regulator [Spirosoma sp.]|uniref:helix-turn-helix domain-containing protein n=1 Tax=Spirosoma sp. TaxID=1899569 RepID=UPI00262801E0|nr:AraC family transcriptional regulator [Spirosoma sp.]MCX6218433.1 helix-turn-helix transcriptional regulator [Spirosoma sp.]